jgi:hypothetical protein
LDPLNFGFWIADLKKEILIKEWIDLGFLILE